MCETIGQTREQNGGKGPTIGRNLAPIPYQSSWAHFTLKRRLALEFKHPFAAYNIFGCLWRNKGPCAVFEESIELNLHGIMPFTDLDNIGEASGFKKCSF
jgi:hypothetical protein